MPEFLTRMDVGKVNFDYGNPDGADRVPERYAGVCVGASIKHNRRKRAQCLLNPGYEIPFRIGLAKLNLDPAFRRALLDHRLNLSERGFAVSPRFTSTQQVQIRSVEEQNFHCAGPQSSGWLVTIKPPNTGALIPIPILEQIGDRIPETWQQIFAFQKTATGNEPPLRGRVAHLNALL